MNDQQFPLPAQPEQNYEQVQGPNYFAAPNYSLPTVNYAPPGSYQPYYAPQPFVSPVAGYNPYLPFYPHANLLSKARFRQRLSAILIDLVSFIALCIVTIMGGFVVFNVSWHNRNTQTSSFSSNGWEALGLMLSLILMGMVIVVLTSAIYFTITIGRGQTLGCKVAGIRLVKANGEKPGYGRAFARILLIGIISYILSPISPLIFLIGAILWPLWDKQKQNLFDKATGIYAISTRA